MPLPSPGVLTTAETTSAPAAAYTLIFLCPRCADKRVFHHRKPHRAVPTLLEAAWHVCRLCTDVMLCGTFRDYGKD